MNGMAENQTGHRFDFYSAQYGRLGTDTAAEIRREVYGEDLGQQGWRTLDEQAQIADLIGSSPCHVLDIACGSGGPSLALVARTGCTLRGIDIEPRGIEYAQRLAMERGLADRADFAALDCSNRLPFEDESFDVVVCIDAISHLGDRFAALSEWSRLLRPGGRLLFTDSVVLTGPVTIDELVIRASLGAFVFVPPGLNESAVTAAGLILKLCENRTRATAEIAHRQYVARESRSSELIKAEGTEWYSQRQRFLSVAAEQASSGRLSRFLYVAEKPRAIRS
jgi:2-polyprenyl-3-methyl-5-hydroxy-6-metoxy-1,4-benzoquinol methylase